MASRKECDPRHWHTFHSTKTCGTRYRHQVKQVRKTGQWLTQIEVLEPADNWPYYTTSVPVPERHGQLFFSLTKVWTNVDEDEKPMYPEGYVTGFKNLEA
jgi:hypothetical protein